eukprot:gnl/TRDRNA2_/TRDRNA2_133551_c0_seq1.p1 gnl/TRDRNA2_/TRDRNA2_133551_c0~~gnl/TRDRNA2_/TRDRNA2_133551_c0_seq1.p1  ORF type:complete len:250 (+),score=38.60 gnl/TRDRNA2_/TRDRNA2_133551_c0_seq1:92-841(+)
MTSVYVEVNVGGKVFSVSTGTLRKSPFFASLLSDDLTDDLKDHKGRLFVDRDPELFAEVLRLLRGYPAQDTLHMPWSVVKAEADFYQVPVVELTAAVEVVIPPDILCVQRLYAEMDSLEPLHRDEICLHTMRNLPQDLQTRVRIAGLEVIPGGETKTVFAVSKRTLEEASFVELCGGVWERTERRCYHKKGAAEIVIPEHPMEVSREHHAHYVCVTYALPPVNNPVTTVASGVVGTVACATKEWRPTTR